MAELEAEGVEHEARRPFALDGSEAVALVPQDRQTVFRQVHPDLMLAPGAGTGFDEEPARAGLEETEVGLGILSKARSGGDLTLPAPLARGKRSSRGGGERVVRLHDPSLGELTRETRVGGAILREDNDPGGVAIEALVDAETDLARARGARGEQLGQPAHEVGPPRVHRLVGGKARRLADGHEPGVLEQDVGGR
jgi:hypothetical protein